MKANRIVEVQRHMYAGKSGCFQPFANSGNRVSAFANAVKASFASEQHNMGCKLVREAIFLKPKSFCFLHCMGNLARVVRSFHSKL